MPCFASVSLGNMSRVIESEGSFFKPSPARCGTDGGGDLRGGRGEAHSRRRRLLGVKGASCLGGRGPAGFRAEI